MSTIKPVKIVFKDTKTGEYMGLPVTPEDVAYGSGAAKRTSVSILTLGDVSFFDGLEQGSITLKSFFPGTHDPSFVYFPAAQLKSPLVYKTKFEEWKKNDTPIQMVIAVLGVNVRMKVVNIDWQPMGFDGSISYTIELVEDRVIKVQKVAVGGTVKAANKKDQKNRPPIAKQDKPKTYTVKSGDTITGIAKKNGITDWHTLYNKNKKVIGNSPNKLRPGMVLSL